MEGRQIAFRLPDDHWRAWKEEAHRRRVSGNQLLLDLLHAVLVQEGHRVCPYCEPGDRDCAGYGECHCGCGMSVTEMANVSTPDMRPLKYRGDHHSRPVPLAG